MQKYKVLLVDDEFLALNILEKYASELYELEIVKKCKSALVALEILNSEQIDILFLDIQMPTLSGTNLLKTIRNQPATIFTTAYSEHAVLAFELNAVDYLLKPFSFERFLQAVNKAKESLAKKKVPTIINEIQDSIESEVKDYLVYRVDGKIEKIFFRDIILIEGMREYVKFVCVEKNYIVLESMKNLESSLPTNEFIRVHKSFIICKKRVKTLDGNQLILENHRVTISREKKDEIIKEIFGI